VNRCEQASEASSEYTAGPKGPMGSGQFYCIHIHAHSLFCAVSGTFAMHACMHACSFSLAYHVSQSTSRINMVVLSFIDIEGRSILD
jgi:hypothetical protein